MSTNYVSLKVSEEYPIVKQTDGSVFSDGNVYVSDDVYIRCSVHGNNMQVVKIEDDSFKEFRATRDFNVLFHQLRIAMHRSTDLDKASA